MTPASGTSSVGRCLTCGDLAVVLRVAALHADGVAICETPDAAREMQGAPLQTPDAAREARDGARETLDGASEAQDGARETVDVSLIEPPQVGDRVLVHAGVALAHLGDRAQR